MAKGLLEVHMKKQWTRPRGLFLLGIVLSFLWTIPTLAQTSKASIFPAYTGSKAQIMKEGVDLLAYPSQYSQVIGQVSTDDLFILGSNQDWYRVRVHDQEGWLPKTDLKVNEESFIPYSRVLGEEVVAYGKLFIGTPYVWGGNDLISGVDCSGLTKQIFEGFAIHISRLSYTQVNDGQIIDKSELRPGDLVFFDTSGVNNGNISHVGIYAGNGMFLHADATHGVMLSNLQSPYYTRNYVTSSRIINDL